MNGQVFKVSEVPAKPEPYMAHCEDVRLLLERRRQLRAELAELERQLLKTGLGEQMLG